MKKFVKSMLALVMVVVLAIGVVGCDKVSKLLPEEKGGYSFSIREFECLSSTKNYSMVDYVGKYILLQDIDDGYYQVIDVEKDEKVCASKNQIKIIDNGLFAWYNPTKEIYSVYADGRISDYSEGQIDTTNHVFVDSATLARTYVDVNGKVKTENNCFAKILTNSDYYNQLGDNYVKFVDDLIIEVFNKNGNYVRTVDIGDACSFASDEVQLRSWYIDDTLFLQTSRVLTDDSKDYDYTEAGTKYEFTTYSYNVSKNKVKKINDFDYLVNRFQYATDEMAVLSVQKIEDKKISNVSFAQSFEKDGDVYVDLQEIVPGAKAFSFISEKYSMITDAVGDVHIFRGDDKLMVIPEQQMGDIIGSYMYAQSGSQLFIFDLANGAAVNKIEDVQQVRNYGTKIIYIQQNESIHKICVFDTNNKTTQTYTLEDDQIANMYGDYIAVREESKTKELIFCAGDTIEKVEVGKSYEGLGSCYDSKNSVKYSILRLVDNDDDVSYKVLKYTYPTNK